MQTRQVSAVGLGLLLAVCAAGALGDVVETVGGERIEGAVTRIDAAAVHVASAAGEKPVPRGDVLGIRFAPGPEAALAPRWIVAGRERGDRMLAAGLDLAEGRLSLTGAGWKISRADVAYVASIEDGRKAASADGALPRPSAVADLLVVRNDGGRAQVEGRLVAAGADAITWELAGARRLVPADRVAAVVLRQGEPPAVEGSAAAAVLADGSRLTLANLRLGAEGAEADWGGGRWSAGLHVLREVRLAGGRVVFLSDLEPDRVEATPFWPGAPMRQWRRDAGVDGGPLAVRGTAFSRGIGMQARCRLVYSLPGRPEARLLATLGVDDAAGGGGRVIFRVSGDGRALFESKTLTGKSPPLPIDLDVSGVRSLAIEADFGADTGSDGDCADWGGARIVYGTGGKR